MIIYGKNRIKSIYINEFQYSGYNNIAQSTNKDTLINFHEYYCSEERQTCKEWDFVLKKIDRKYYIVSKRIL